MTTGRQAERVPAGDRQGREGSRKRVAKPRLRGEHSASRMAGAELERKTTARSVQEAGARKYGPCGHGKDFLCCPLGRGKLLWVLGK